MPIILDNRSTASLQGPHLFRPVKECSLTYIAYRTAQNKHVDSLWTENKQVTQDRIAYLLKKCSCIQ